MKILSAQEVADLYKVSKATVLNHIKRGLLEASKRLNQYVINEQDAHTWAQSQGLT